MKKLIINTVFFTVTFLITLFILDRYILISYIENNSTTDFTEEYGRCRVKNKRFVYFNEGFGIGRFNEGRYIGHYYPTEKPDSVIRIAILGDSYVEAFQVFERDHFITLLEKELNQNLPDSFQVLNFGRSGFDFGDMYAYYERMVKPYNCNVVMFFIANGDLNIKQTDLMIPKVLDDSNNSIIVTNDLMPASYLSAFLGQLKIAHNSLVYQMLNNSRKIIGAGELNHKLFDKFAPNKQMLDKVDDQSIKIQDIKISELSYKILNHLNNEPTQFYFVNRGKEPLYIQFSDSIKQHFVFIDLFSDSGLYKNNNNPHLWPATGKTGHWNREGHERVANQLVKIDFN